MEHRIDPWMVLAVLGIFGGSLTTLSAVAPVLGRSLLPRQLLWATVGIALLWLLSRVHPSVFERVAPVAYGLGLLALLTVITMGVVRGGTRGWFAVGSLTLQPSEFARLTTAMMVAAIIGRRGRTAKLGQALMPTAVVAMPMVLILLQPDLGVALTYLPLLFAAWWLGGLPLRAWVALAVISVVLAGAVWQIGLKPYQKERVLTLIDPERDPYGAGYQVRQSKIAVGSGQVLGHGLGRGGQSLLRFLPAQHTDFVYAAWTEATGFLGGTALLVAYALLLIRIGVVAVTAPSRHGLAFATLVGTWLAFQIVVNIGMVLGWLPTTGITLPLFSYGGSSLLATCAALGIVQSVWRNRLVNQ